MNTRNSFLHCWLLAAAVAALPMCALADSAGFVLNNPPRGGEKLFNSAQEAVDALTQAATNHDITTLHEIFGPTITNLISPDPVQASNSFAYFVQRITAKVEMTHPTPSQIILELGDDGWPFPIPLEQNGSASDTNSAAAANAPSGAQWYFDTESGMEEVLNRRIGMDELAVIDVCHAYVDAQREYASDDHTGAGVLEYAQHLRSTSGAHDGLYWHAEPGEDMSPLGPLIAEARMEGYTHANKILNGPQSPYHGYFFKILTRQGKHAPGGAYNYVINGHMIGGFALVAWPAEWGNTGIMTFIVNQQGKIYQKCLGAKTARIAARMTRYDPDDTWKPAE